jgi:four helix bundle protein
MMPYERFKAWGKCHELAIAVYLVTRKWPREETYGLIAQSRRAAFSAAANIVEGSSRKGSKEFRRFLDISLGSLCELAYILRLAADIGLTEPEEASGLDMLRETASKLTWGLYDAIRKSGRATDRPTA